MMHKTYRWFKQQANNNDCCNVWNVNHNQIEYCCNSERISMRISGCINVCFGATHNRKKFNWQSRRPPNITTSDIPTYEPTIYKRSTIVLTDIQTSQTAATPFQTLCCYYRFLLLEIFLFLLFGKIAIL